MKIYLAVITILFCQVADSQSHFAGQDAGVFSHGQDNTVPSRSLVPFTYNSKGKAEGYPFLSQDGAHLYFTNNQTYNWLFYSHKDSVSGVWSVPVPLEIAKFKTPVASAYLCADNQTLFITSEEDGLFKCSSVDGSYYKFTHPEKIEIINPGGGEGYIVRPFSCLSFSPDMQQMLAYVGRTGIAMTSYRKTGDNTYTFEKFFPMYDEYMGVMGDDGLRYYFTKPYHDNVLFYKQRNSLSEDFGPETHIAITFEPKLEILQVRVAEKANTLVLVLNDTMGDYNGSWNGNDIFFYDYGNDIGNNPILISETTSDNKGKVNPGSATPVTMTGEKVPETLNKTELINHNGLDIVSIELGNPFPNPCKDLFYIYYHVRGENPAASLPVLVLIDQSGHIVYTQKLESLLGEVLIKPDHLAAGNYYLRIDYNGLSSTTAKIAIGL